MGFIQYMRAGFEEQGAPPRDWRPPTPPTATAGIPDTVTTADTALTFTVTYADDRGVDLSSLDSQDLRLVRRGDGGPRLDAALLSAQPGSDNTVLATYQVQAPKTVWRPQDHGRYSLAVADEQVRASESRKSIGKRATPGATGPLPAQRVTAPAA